MVNWIKTLTAFWLVTPRPLEAGVSSWTAPQTFGFSSTMTFGASQGTRPYSPLMLLGLPLQLASGDNYVAAFASSSSTFATSTV